MNITLIRSNKRKNSTTYNSAEYLISKLENVDKVYEFTLPEDMPHICCGCYACIKGDEEKCGGYKYLKPILDAFDDSSLIIFCSPVYVGHIPGQIKSFLDHFGSSVGGSGLGRGSCFDRRRAPSGENNSLHSFRRD